MPIVAVLLLAATLPAFAYETNGTIAWTGTAGSNTGTVTEPSGLIVRAQTSNATGVTTIGTAAVVVSQPMNSRGATAAIFGTQDSADADAFLDTPSTIAVGSTLAVNIVTGAGSCPVATGRNTTTIICDSGTLTISFNRPVRNPVIHVSGLGGVTTSSTGGTITNEVRLNARLALTGSAPAGATMGALSAGRTNLTLTGGTLLETVAVTASAACNTINDGGGSGANALAGCGSIQVNGTVTSLTFAMSLKYRQTSCPVNCTATSMANAADAFNLDVSLPQDLSDAPASFGVPLHVVGDLRIGAVNDADRTNTENPATSPFAAVSPADALGDDSEANGADDNQPGDDEDGVTFNGGLTTALIGANYVANIALGGVSQAGEVCGWIDFNRNAAFDAAERTCATFTTGATTAALTWTVPTATAAGRAYARVRAVYGAAGAAGSPSGNAASGEVEDYQLDIKPVVRIVKALVDTTPTPGTFNLSIGGTVFASAVGNGGTTGYKTVYTTSRSGQGAANANTANDVNVIASIESANVTTTTGETAANAVPLTNYTTTVACVNAAGSAVTFTAGADNQSVTSLTIPQSVTGAAANGRAQTITCTYTNTRAGADLSVTKTNTPALGPNDQTGDTTVVGESRDYSIVVRNGGPGAADNAVLSDSVGGNLSCTAVTCSVTAGSAVCPAVTVAALQAGLAIATFPANSALTFVLRCTTLADLGPL